MKLPTTVTIDEQIRHVERELEWQLRRAPARRESPAGRYVDRDLERWRAVLATLKAVRARGASGA